jgi:hypothetical protein
MNQVAVDAVFLMHQGDGMGDVEGHLALGSNIGAGGESVIS